MDIASHLTSLEMLDSDFIENAEALGREIYKRAYIGRLITEIPLNGISSFIFQSTTMWLIWCLLDHELIIKMFVEQ